MQPKKRHEVKTAHLLSPLTRRRHFYYRLGKLRAWLCGIARNLMRRHGPVKAERAADFVDGESAEFELALAVVVIVLSEQSGATPKEVRRRRRIRRKVCARASHAETKR